MYNSYMYALKSNMAIPFLVAMYIVRILLSPSLSGALGAFLQVHKIIRINL